MAACRRCAKTREGLAGWNPAQKGAHQEGKARRQKEEGNDGVHLTEKDAARPGLAGARGRGWPRFLRIQTLESPDQLKAERSPLDRRIR